MATSDMLCASEALHPDIFMGQDEQQFFKELGARIAQLRKEAGLSQQAVADALELPQQTYANYEVARARPPVSMLPPLAELFGTSVDELSGSTTRLPPASAASPRSCSSRWNASTTSPRPSRRSSWRCWMAFSARAAADRQGPRERLPLPSIDPLFGSTQL
jgi:transcriptional regulator with XRE-family HTH domain